MQIGDWLLIDVSSQMLATSSSPPLISRFPVGSKEQQNTADSVRESFENSIRSCIEAKLVYIKVKVTNLDDLSK